MTTDLVVDIEFLTGRYVATAHDRRDAAEWPPHPARLFSALVAAWGEGGDDPDNERAVIESLERLGPPTIEASAAVSRRVVDHFVPVNDPSTSFNQSRAYSQVAAAQAAITENGPDSKVGLRSQKKLDKARDVIDRVTKPGTTNPSTALALLDRPKQARTYPSVTPDHPTVTMRWRDCDWPDEQRAVLDRLLERVTRLGHSSSLTSCHIRRHDLEPTSRDDAEVWEPDPTSDRTIRWVGDGQLAMLVDRYEQHRGTLPRSLPAVSVRYRRQVDTPAAAWVAATAGDWVTLEFTGDDRVLPIDAAAAVARAVRGSILRHATDPVSELLSGHQPAGATSQTPHVAFLPLPRVHDRWADGTLLGCAIALPHAESRAATDHLLREIGTALREWLGRPDGTGQLRLGRAGVRTVRLTDVASGGGLHTLRRDTWSGPATTWVSATPIALPVHPGRRSRVTATGDHWARVQAAVAGSCEHVGLPRPQGVMVSKQPLLTGTRSTGGYPPFEQPARRHDGRRVRRFLIHARVEFDEPVVGPVALGAGRYLGLGLMRPMRSREDGPWPT